MDFDDTLKKEGRRA